MGAYRKVGDKPGTCPTRSYEKRKEIYKMLIPKISFWNVLFYSEYFTSTRKIVLNRLNVSLYGNILAVPLEDILAMLMCSPILVHQTDVPNIRAQDAIS
jgi:hypothetical protein